MKDKWQTILPKINPETGKSKVLLCKVQWEKEWYPCVAFYNSSEWINVETKNLLWMKLQVGKELDKI